MSQKFNSRMWLHWDERLKDFVHKPSGMTLDELAKAARQHGYYWHLSHPGGRKARWVWFEVTRPAPVHRTWRRR